MDARRLVIGGLLVVVGVSGGMVAADRLRADQPGRPGTEVAVDEPATDRHLSEPGPDPGPTEDAASAAWLETVAAAQVELDAAEAVLDGTAGQVDDDAVRVELADAVAAARAAVDAEPTAEAEATLADAVAALGPAAAAVRQSHRIWAVDHPDLAPPPPDPRTATSDGAGPDCGGPDSAEPPSGDGPVLFASTPAATGDGSNGRIPRSQLTALPWCADSQGNRQWLRPDAADALIALNEEFRAEFGENIAIDLSYRSYADQVVMREVFGALAAQPGTSNHGLGTAVDTWEWRAYAFGSARYAWLVEHGPAHGWIAPSWAREDGSNPEYWHFEYHG